MSPQIWAAIIAGSVSAVGIAGQAALASRSHSAAQRLLREQAMMARRVEALASIRNLAMFGERVRIAARTLAAAVPEPSAFEDTATDWHQAVTAFGTDWARVRVDAADLYPDHLEALRKTRHQINHDLHRVDAVIHRVYRKRSADTVEQLRDAVAEALRSLDEYVSWLSNLGRP
jgi:hypothetical protein